MENPHEQVQNALLERIINNMQSLNDSVVIMNNALAEVNYENVNIEMLLIMWEHYIRNANFHLEATGNLKDPL
ncbi:hypothetical protein PACTADRAFT_43396 [Pachysolen tannophilus NRRL Y-2460]|uniref:DASH complex subunit DAD4 n=1 Tax=Pachysolen tannophilus NRRL Y-2460 TaxID=669874 RepID=A0A1E4TSB2_PACTA|nr:hypothetical protein PACTADRAFT_43396 [Pachysolen tannophilus NRRL Y-2460]